MSDPTTYALHKMSWPEVAKAAETVELVLIPIGSTEQHGPNLGLGQDHVIANAYCERAAERLAPRLLALPAIPWGISDHHMNFPAPLPCAPRPSSSYWKTSSSPCATTASAASSSSTAMAATGH